MAEEQRKELIEEGRRLGFEAGKALGLAQAQEEENRRRQTISISLTTSPPVLFISHQQFRPTLRPLHHQESLKANSTWQASRTAFHPQSSSHPLPHRKTFQLSAQTTYLFVLSTRSNVELDDLGSHPRALISLWLHLRYIHVPALCHSPIPSLHVDILGVSELIGSFRPSRHPHLPHFLRNILIRFCWIGWES
ncbi:hypothetical protein D9758_013706 [Tetrapyrgos nigripes]|uniref:Uncharacterized protein n=1 Tax=Tetrapyrgos nigripes TaxID=182062 RepID=A0A8H5CJI7_9AGAR|nr:hypothetical protein D9758_013706 [Tetrapyrgos nigripes]